MKTPNWKPEIIKTINGIDYVLSFEEDHLDAKHHFINECEWTDEQYSEIKNSFWFIACITPVKNGHSFDDCAVYLGGNCYKNKKEVMSGEVLGGYAPQLIEEAQEKVNKILN